MIPDLRVNCASERELLEEVLLGNRVKLLFCTDTDSNNNIVAILFGDSCRIIGLSCLISSYSVVVHDRIMCISNDDDGY